MVLITGEDYMKKMEELGSEGRKKLISGLQKKFDSCTICDEIIYEHPDLRHHINPEYIVKTPENKPDYNGIVQKMSENKSDPKKRTAQICEDCHYKIIGIHLDEHPIMTPQGLE